MWLNVIGLGLDLVGAVLVGVVVPRHSHARVKVRSGPDAPFSPAPLHAPLDSLGLWADRLGWPCLILGFVGQLLGQFIR